MKLYLDKNHQLRVFVCGWKQNKATVTESASATVESSVRARAARVESEPAYLWWQRWRDFCFHGRTKNTENIESGLCIWQMNYYTQLLFKDTEEILFLKYFVKCPNSIKWNIQKEAGRCASYWFRMPQWSKVEGWHNSLLFQSKGK